MPHRPAGRGNQIDGNQNVFGFVDGALDFRRAACGNARVHEDHPDIWRSSAQLALQLATVVTPHVVSKDDAQQFASFFLKCAISRSSRRSALAPKRQRAPIFADQSDGRIGHLLRKRQVFRAGDDGRESIDIDLGGAVQPHACLGAQNLQNGFINSFLRNLAFADRIHQASVGAIKVGEKQ